MFRKKINRNPFKTNNEILENAPIKGWKLGEEFPFLSEFSFKIIFLFSQQGAGIPNLVLWPVVKLAHLDVHAGFDNYARSALNRTIALFWSSFLAHGLLIETPFVILNAPRVDFNRLLFAETMNFDATNCRTVIGRIQLMERSHLILCAIAKYHGLACVDNKRLTGESNRWRYLT